ASDPRCLRRILAQAKAPLRDAAAINSTRWALFRALEGTGLPIEAATGGRTKFNRAGQGYPKAHWIDAACAGSSGAAVRLDPALNPLCIVCRGRGSRRVTRQDRFGFPRTAAGRIKRVHRFSTGDLVRLRQPWGKHAGVHEGRLAGIRADGRLDVQAGSGRRITAHWTRFTLLQRGDGYAYVA
ncbi:MAG: hypothetical protein JXR29_06655, partial [Methylothermaceae bacterium]|nr:hypothetical protein [Methylothermaceae bacterium]